LRSNGFPGNFIGALPVNAFIHPAGLPINTSKIEVLRRPVESAHYTSAAFAQVCGGFGIRRSMGRVGSSYDNARRRHGALGHLSPVEFEQQQQRARVNSH
jgi:hypothetical protein